MIPKSKRLRITTAVFLYVAILTGVATFRGLENLAIAGITVITGAVSVYVWGETKRKSDEQL